MVMRPDVLEGDNKYTERYLEVSCHVKRRAIAIWGLSPLQSYFSSPPASSMTINAINDIADLFQVSSMFIHL